jgi:hypothetical protein
MRAHEYQFQSRGGIDALQEPYCVRSTRQEFSHTVEPDIEFEPERIVEPRDMPFDMKSRKRMNRKMAKQQKEKRKRKIFMILEMSLLLKKPQDLHCY